VCAIEWYRRAYSRFLVGDRRLRVCAVNWHRCACSRFLVGDRRLRVCAVNWHRCACARFLIGDRRRRVRAIHVRDRRARDERGERTRAIRADTELRHRAARIRDPRGHRFDGHAFSREAQIGRELPRAIERADLRAPFRMQRGIIDGAGGEAMAPRARERSKELLAARGIGARCIRPRGIRTLCVREMRREPRGFIGGHREARHFRDEPGPHVMGREQERLHPGPAQTIRARQRRDPTKARDALLPPFEMHALRRERTRVDLLVTSNAVLVLDRGLDVRDLVTARALELHDQVARITPDIRARR